MPRARTPNAVKKLTGNPGKRPYNADAPQPTGELVPPMVMSPEGLVIWRRLVASQVPGTYASVDAGLLAAYCEQQAMAERAVALMLDPNHQPLTPGSQGQMVVSPLIKIMNEAHRNMLSLSGPLFLNPASRNALQQPDKPADGDFVPAPLKKPSEANPPH